MDSVSSCWRGGGAFSRTDGLNPLNSPGIAAIQQSFDLNTTGPNGMGGKGFFITQEIPDGNPRDGGLIVTTNISGGGGGAYGDATQSCGGKKGMDEGGTSTLCSNGKAGGYGFGAGGSGLNRLMMNQPFLAKKAAVGAVVVIPAATVVKMQLAVLVEEAMLASWLLNLHG
jgi:hypothetical protein